MRPLDSWAVNKPAVFEEAVGMPPASFSHHIPQAPQGTGNEETGAYIQFLGPTRQQVW